MFSRSKKIEAAAIETTVQEVVAVNANVSAAEVTAASIAYLPKMATDQLAQLIENEIEEDGSVIDPNFRKAVVAEIASRNPVPAAKPLSKKAAKKAAALAASEAPATASEPPTLADLADVPSFAVPGATTGGTSTTAPKAARVAAPKAPKAAGEKTANQQIVFALLARDEGATIGDIVAAIGPKGSAISWLRSAAKNGYATRIEKVEGKNRYYATKRPA